MNWELRASSSFPTNNRMLTSGLPVKSGQALVDLGFQDAPTKQALGDSVLDALRGRVRGGRDVNGCVYPSVGATDEFLFGEDDFSLKLPGSMVDPSLLIDLKLEKLTDHRNSHSSRIARDDPTLSLSESSTPSKRCRIFGVTNQVAYCQVYGCHKDLSSSKEYHKKHKVCELHSKTPKVIVKGVEQRFCQQCSRFHLLSEFDDGKRSCRKRLAGHNERRRKPHNGFHSSGRTESFFLPFNVCKFHGTNELMSHIRLEAMTNNIALPLSSYQYQDLHTGLPFSAHSSEELRSFKESNRDSSTAVSTFSNITHNPSPLFNEGLSVGSEEFGTIFNTESPIRGFSGTSELGCARSLLSSQSQKSSGPTSAIPVDQSLSRFSINQVSDNPAVNGEFSRFLSSMEGSKAGPAVVSDSGSAGPEISDKILQGSGFSNTKDYFSGEEIPTIDLLQLSSKLQQVEHERQFLKLEFDSF